VGPWKLKGEFGAAAAVIVVKHSFYPEVTESTVQYYTVRKIKSAFVSKYGNHWRQGREESVGFGGSDLPRVVQ
jgi:hypothetical protein